MKQFDLIPVLMVLVFVGCANTTESIVTSEADNESMTPKVFEPENELRQLLGERMDVHGHSIRPPNGYTHVSPKGAPRGVVASGWTGKQRPDGTTPMLQLMIVSPPEGESVPELDDAMPKMLAGIKERLTNWKDSELTFGTINGRRFARQSWEGVEPTMDRAARGITYVSVSGNRIFHLQTMDVEPEFEGLSIGEASLLTFK